jgi:dipeptidyl aminopeptidase/acylaminoacyl peptidase
MIMRRLTVLTLFVAMLASVAVRAAEQEPLLPFSLFFAPAEVDGPLMSPDGKWISYIARYQDAFNIFLAPADNVKAAKPLTKEHGRGIQWYTVSGAVNYAWTPDSRHIVYLKDNDGDEHNRIYSVDVTSGKVRALTPGDKVRAHMIAVSTSRPEWILAAVDTRFLTGSHTLQIGFDIVEINVATGERKVALSNIPYAFVVADNDLKVRLAGVLTKTLGVDLVKIAPDGSASPFYSIGPDDMGGLAATGETKSLRVSADNKTLYMLDDVGSDTVAVVSLDLETGKKRTIASDPRVDIRDVVFDPATNAVDAYGTLWTRLEWHAVDPDLKDDFAFLAKYRDGDIRVPSRSADGRFWLVRYTESDRPETYFRYDAQTKAMTKLFVTTPALEGLKLSKMQPYVVKSRDGRFDLVGYYMLPLAADPEQDGKPTKPVPTVVLIHGGPTDERPTYAYAPFVQWLTNRGYGMLYVDFRGSAGFGKAFRNGQRFEWGGKMHDDVMDQVDWAIAKGLVDPKHVAAIGGSYGGYATLIAMTKTPDRFACGISLVGPSDLTVPMPHWSDDWIADTLGNPKTAEGQAMLKARSPVFFAHQATSPILIGQGDKDTRVPTEQSNKMVDALKKAGAHPVYLLYPDEGHGLLRPENSNSFWAISEVFLSGCLGGRAQPLTPAALKGSSVIVKEGADQVPGLEAALAARK